MEAKIKLEQDLVTYIQTLWYEIQMKEEIVQKIISDCSAQGKSINDMSALKEYEKQIVELKAEYDIVFDELQNTVLKPLDGHSYNFNINFRECTLNLTINCECGEKIYKEQMLKEW